MCMFEKLNKMMPKILSHFIVFVLGLIGGYTWAYKALTACVK